MTAKNPAGARVYSILIVDDEAQNRQILAHLLHAQGYATRQAETGEAALKALSESPADLVLLDLEMPGMSGFDVVHALKADPETKAIPTIIVTGLTDRDSRLAALGNGAEDFLTKPVDAAELAIRVRNHLRLKEYGDFLREYSETLESRVRVRTSQLRDSYRETIFLLTSAAEFRDEDTGSHIRRMSHYTAEMARHMGRDEEFVDCIFFASPMHDIGKIAVPDSVLLKPGPLDAKEWDLMKSHTIFGKRILSGGTTAYMKMGAEIAGSHHERWDGTGYPSGLAGDRIPLPGLIMGICDVYDALRSRRPYKKPLSHEQAVGIITRGDGRTEPKHFCPGVLSSFVDCSGVFRKIYEKHGEGADAAAEPERRELQAR